MTTNRFYVICEDKVSDYKTRRGAERDLGRYYCNLEHVIVEGPAGLSPNAARQLTHQPKEQPCPTAQ